MDVRISTWSALFLAGLSVAVSAGASEESSGEDPVFWSDPRGVVFSLDGVGDDLDLVRLGQLRDRYEAGMAHLNGGRWEEAAVDLEGVAEELAIPAVLHGAAVAHFQLEHYAHARQLLEMSVAVDPEDERANNLLGLVLGALGRPADALPYLQRCWELSGASGNAAFEAFAMLNLAQMELELGHPEQARKLAEDALAIGQQRRYGNVIAVARNSLGNVALYLGDLKGAEKQYRKSMQVERRGRGNEDKGAILNNLANVLSGRGEIEAARELLVEALAECRSAGHRAQEGGVLVTLAGLEHRMGQGQTAQEHLEQALAIFDDLELQRGRAEVRLQQARIARGEERPRAADEFLELARIALRDLALPQLVAQLDLVACEVNLDRGDPGAAAAAGEAAGAWFRGADRPVDGAGATLCWADARAAMGGLEDARGGYQSAVEILQGTDGGARLADARQRSGLFELRHGDVDEGGRRLDLAAAWLEDAGRHRELAIARNLEGYALHQRELTGLALTAFERASGAAAEAEDAELISRIRGNRIQMLVLLDRHAEARRLAEQGGDPGDISLVALAEAQLGFRQALDAMDAERWEDASEALQRVLALLPADDEQVRPSAQANLRMVEHRRGLDALERGDLAAAIGHLEAAMDQLSHAEDPATEARLLHDLAVVRLELQDLERAATLLRQAMTSAVAADDADLQRSVQFQLGLVLLEEDPGAAEVALRSCLTLADGATDELAAATRYNLGILLYRGGEYRASFDSLAASREIYRALGREDQVAIIDGYLEEFPPLDDP